MTSEDGEKFLTEFHSYLTLSNIDTGSPQATAAFHLHFWFGLELLTSSDRSSFYHVKAMFREEFCSDTNPALITEETTFRTVTLRPEQQLEDYHSHVLQKGKRLHKTERDITAKFIDGLPSQLAFFVRAGKATTLREALHSAKIGEAHGYRVQDPCRLMAAAATPQPAPVDKTYDLFVQINTQLQSLSKRLESLEVKGTKPNPRQPHDRWSKDSSGGTRTCFHCGGEGHIRRNCNWSGNGHNIPD
ncbi:uncharacterized protein LOC117315247 [Pecten maximus]|uniref:uncharacterized protein LOC117315247 n=1 Tax=Pecten maximus TaxID=6579 RepID=UPI0014588CF2|nr:uncharacterized protein LOC117315247 [Pecten maximus]